MRSLCRIFATGVSLCVGLVVPRVAQAQQAPFRAPLPVAGENRPANVPANYVVTPFGYFDPACVQRLAKGDRQMANGQVQHSDGKVVGTPANCASPRFSASGVQAFSAGRGSVTQGAQATRPEVNGWVENANVVAPDTTQSFGALLARWTVPPQPRFDDGQVLFYFPGLEDIDATQSILQPVLAWYQGQWTIASWNCCLSGIITVSPALAVNPGDQIYGAITNSCLNGTPVCANWNVLSVDLSTGQSTILSNTPSDGQLFNWAFGGVMEPYYVVRCGDYPTNKRLAFDDIVLFNNDLQQVSRPNWTSGYNSTVQPQCDYGVDAAPQKVALTY